MSLEKLIEAGAQAVGGVVYLNNVAMGSFQPEGFALNDAGKAHFQTEEAVSPAPAPAPAPRARKQAAAAPAPVQDQTPAADASGLEDLLPS